MDGRGREGETDAGEGEEGGGMREEQQKTSLTTVVD